MHSFIRQKRFPQREWKQLKQSYYSSPTERNILDISDFPHRSSSTWMVTLMTRPHRDRTNKAPMPQTPHPTQEQHLPTQVSQAPFNTARQHPLTSPTTTNQDRHTDAPKIRVQWLQCELESLCTVFIIQESLNVLFLFLIIVFIKNYTEISIVAPKYKNEGHIIHDLLCWY